MTPSQRLVPSSTNNKKLKRPQRTQQSKSTVGLTSTDLYNFDSDAPTAVSKDGFFCSHIACEPEKILSATGCKGIAADAADNSQPKGKRQIKYHIVGKNKRLRKTPTIIIVGSEDEDEISQDSSQDQSHQDESHQSDTSLHGTLQDVALHPRRTQTINKDQFSKQSDCDFKWIDNTKGLVNDTIELVGKLLPILDKQEEQSLEQRVRVKGLALKLNDIADFLKNLGAQEE